MMLYKILNKIESIELAEIRTNDSLPIAEGVKLRLPCAYNHLLGSIVEGEYMHCIVDYYIDVVNECVIIYVNQNENYF